MQSRFTTPPPGPTTFDSLKDLTNNPTPTTPPHAVRAKLLHWVATMLRDAYQRAKSSRRRYKDNHDRKVRNATLPYSARKSVQISRPPLPQSDWRLSYTINICDLKRAKYGNRRFANDCSNRWRRNPKYCINWRSYISAIGENRRATKNAHQQPRSTIEMKK